MFITSDDFNIKAIKRTTDTKIRLAANPGR